MYSRGPHFSKNFSKNSGAHLYLFIYMKNHCMWNLIAFCQLLNPPWHTSNLQKMPFFTKMALLWINFDCLFSKIETIYFTHNDFQNVGYYPGFYSSLRDKKWRNGEILKINFRITCIINDIYKIHKILNIHAILNFIFKISPFLHFLSHREL